MVPNFAGVPDDRGGVSNSYLLGAGEHSGGYWGINPYDGGLFWQNQVGPGGPQWGTAINTDNNATALIANENGNNINTTLAGSASIAPFTWNGGSWGSINLKTGHFSWQLAAFGNDLTNPAKGSTAPGAISFSNQVAFAGRVRLLQRLHILWMYNTGGSLESAPAIYNDTLYWGAGFQSPTSGKLYAFSIASPASSGRTIPAGR
jgi:hypothetical protein